MRDVLAKMRECGKQAKMRDFPRDCGTVPPMDPCTISISISQNLFPYTIVPPYGVNETLVVNDDN